MFTSLMEDNNKGIKFALVFLKIKIYNTVLQLIALRKLLFLNKNMLSHKKLFPSTSLGIILGCHGRS